MPRVGGHYELPPGTIADPDTTIESTKYNVFTADIEQELNTQIDKDTAQDAALAGISAGTIPFTPTGDIVATTVQAAIVEVDTEMHAADATLQANITAGDALRVLKAGDTMSGHLTLPTGPAAANAVRKDYVDAADATIAASDALKVAKAGDIMTGTLRFNGAAGEYLRSTNGVTYGIVQYADGGSYYNPLITNAGSPTGTWNSLRPFVVTLASGNVTMAHAVTTGSLTSNADVTATGNVWANGNNLYLHSGGTVRLFWDGGNIQCSHNFYAPSGTGFFGANLYTGYAGSSSGNLYFGSSGGHYLQFDGTNYVFGGGATIQTGSGMVTANGYTSRAGTGGATNNPWNFYWTSTNLNAYVDNVYIGYVNLVSDYRIKKDVVDLPGMWDTVKALRPIKYTQKAFSPPVHLEKKDADSPLLFADDDIERWGFIAHELQETMIPSAATGEKDSYDAVQSPNQFTLIAALTKALQEAMARIEALEAKV